MFAMFISVAIGGGTVFDNLYSPYNGSKGTIKKQANEILKKT